MDTAHANASGAQRVSTSLYVGDLPVDLPNPEDALFNLFNKVGMVMSIKVCRDISSQRSLGYAYVNFQNPNDAERALEQLNFAEIRPGRFIRVMWSSRDPTARKSGEGNIFVKNLDPSVDIRVLRDKFATFGNILSLKLALDAAGKSLGYGFVHFEKAESAREAIERTNGVMLNGKALEVSPFIKKADRQKAEEKVFKTVYVKNLSHDAADETIKKFFSQFGNVVSVFSSGHAQHKTKFSLITFETHEAAVAAIDKLHNQKAELSEGDEKLFVCRALKKRDRQAQKTGNAAASLYQNQGRNIYVKHLDDDMNKERFEELFSRFGKITSSALMHDSNGNFRGFGFVCFEAKEAATAAIREMNGKMLYRRPLYVSQAQQKDMRYQMLEDQRKVMTQQQHRMNNMPMAMYNAYPGWNMPAPGGFMGRPPMGPFMGPPNAFMMGPPQMRRPPMMPPPQQQQRPMRMPKMMPQQMMMPPHQGRYTAPQQQHHQQQQQQQRHAIGVTAQDLANMTPEEQKNALGERLYVRIQEINPQQAAKITGMLLEMDTPEILNVLEERSTLLAKVEEAVAVLQQHVGASN